MQLYRQARQEAVVVLALQRRPRDFRQRRHAREQVVLQPLPGAGVFGPHVGLHPDHVPALRRRQLRRHRVERVDLLHRGELRPARRLVRQVGLQEVQVQGVAGRHHHVVAMGGGLDAAFDATPGHHRGLRRQPALDDLVPADQLAVARLQERFQPLEHVRLQRFFVFQPEPAHVRLHRG